MRVTRGLFTIFSFLLFITAFFCTACGDSTPGELSMHPSKPPYDTKQNAGQPPFYSSRSLRFESLSPEDGLSFPEVREVIQDHLGFMWFTTESGLNKYDGYTFTVFKNTPGDPTTLDFDDLDVVFEDSDGTIWVGGSGGVDRFDRQTETFSRLDERGQVFCITEDSYGILWVGFWHGLYGYDRDTNGILFAFPSDSGEVDEPGALAKGQVRSIAEDSQGYLWIGTSTGLYRLDRITRTFDHYRHDPEDPESLSHNEVLAIFEDTHGRLWLGTGGGGLDRLDRASGRFTHYQHEPSNPDSISADTVVSVLEDRAGNLWIGTIGGLDLFDPDREQFSHYRHDAQKPDSISDNIVLSLYEDRSGVLWIATVNGLSKLVPRKNQFVDLQDVLEVSPEVLAKQGTITQLVDLYEGKVSAIFEDQKGRLWFGSMLGGLYRLDPDSGEITVYRHDPDEPTSIKSDRVYAVYQDSVGVLWVGTTNGWLDQWTPQTESFIHKTFIGERIRTINEDSENNLWIGTQGEGLYQLKPNLSEIIHFPFCDSAQWQGQNCLSSHIVEAVYVDQNGVLWIGTYVGGLNLLVEGNFGHYRHIPNDQASLSNNHVLSILEAPDSEAGSIWVGTMGGGLNRFDRQTKTFTRYTMEDGLADDIVNCILADEAGFLWLGTPKGVTRFDPGKETFRNFDASDGAGYGASHPGVCLKSRSGQMYFGTPDGIFVFDPLQVQDNQIPPPVVITSFQVNNQPVRKEIVSDQSIRLTYQENSLSFEFSALDFTAPEKNQYAYRLEGLEEDWVLAGGRRRADYSALQPGNYVFHVKGSNNDGVWNEGSLAVAIEIEPPFWMTWWFLGTAGLLLVGAVYAGYRARIRSLEARGRELENQIEARTQEINKQRLQTEALYRADEDLYRHLDLDQVLQALINTAVQILGADKGALLGWDEGQEHLVIRAAHQFHPDTVKKTSIPRGQGVAGWVAETGKPAVIEDARTDPRVPLEILEAEKIRAFIQVPIQVGGEVFGVFSVNFLEPRSIAEDEKRLLASLAQRAAISIQNAQLYEQAQELAAIQERNRLARELHDAVTQTLFSASLIAEALPTLWERNQEKGRERLTKLRQMSRGALAEMRALLLELRPAALVETDLETLLRQLGEAVTGREGVPVEIEIISKNGGECKLPVDVHIAFYRIAQEALNNVVKHARPSLVKVALRYLCQEDGRLRGVKLIVQDDGRGFDPGDVSPEHLGIGIMRERAQKIKAELTIDSAPGSGTLICIDWIVDEGS